MRDCGLRIERCVDHVSPDAQAALDGGLALHPAFARAPAEDLTVASSRTVARP